MPELPEVETTRRGIEPLIAGRTVARLVLRVSGLRWPFPGRLKEFLAGQTVLAVERRAKYLLLRCTGGTIILHLGMSGHLRVLPAPGPAQTHDHVDILFTDGSCLRFNDPRRFGALLWTTDDPCLHPLLVDLGPEPFSAAMDGNYLWEQSRGRTVMVKTFILDQRVVAGVGNIYAAEALFRAGIRPDREASRIGRQRFDRLADAIRAVLGEAIEAGGTTIRDFRNGDGKPGYFSRQLQIYGREGLPCLRCGRPVRCRRIGGRSSCFCAGCQK